MSNSPRLALVIALGACSGTPSEPAPRAPALGEAAPAPEVADAGLDDGGTVDAAPPPSPLAVPAGALDGFHAALARAAAQAADGRALILMFGDSHTAGDYLTGALRRDLGARFGVAGRGFVLPGKPAIRHYSQRDVRYGATGRWQAELGGKRGDHEPFGLAGVRSHATDKRAVAWVASCDGCPAAAVARFDLYYLRTPTSGTLAFQIDDGAWHKLTTRLPAGATTPAPEVLPVPVAPGPHKLAVRPAGGGPIELFGVALEGGSPGVMVDALGVVGRRLTHLRAWDWAVIGPQVAARAPALVVLQYGTNEADDPTLDLTRLAAAYDEVIARVRAAAPGASILLLGPPDMGAREAGRAACNALPPPTDPDAGVPVECQWRTPALVPLVIDVQRQAAARNQVAFFDTFAAMGGGNLMDGFVHADPPLAYPDHVHFNQAGYQVWAQLLEAALLADHERWRAAASAAP
ncbi:MAG: GDSL-type esterase/lipase family protein [Kofleriaceae bacterium]